MAERRNVALLVNPSAGGGRARKLLPRIAGALAANIADVNLKVVDTTSFSDARDRAEAIVAGANGANGQPDVLVVMGGDGMASIGLNACANTDVQLGVVPAGTGDDFARGMGVPRKPIAAVEAIIKGDSRWVDVMSAEGKLTFGHQQRFIGSVVSTGYDAKVNYRVNNSSTKLGKLSYGWHAITELAAFEPLNYRLTINGEVQTLPAMMVCVANAGYFGGGVWIAPQADVTDGLLDVTLIHPVSRLTLLRLLPFTYSGGHVHDPAVERFRVSSIGVDGDNMYAMADGENLGDVPLQLSAVPRALHLLGRRDTSV